MPKQTLNTIKNWFRTRMKPTQQQFWDTWDSFWHKDNEIPQSAIKDLDTTLQGKADQSALQGHIEDENAHPHTHEIADVDGLEEALEGKAPVDHTHAISDVAGLVEELEDRAPVDHTHEIEDVVGLETVLATKTSSVPGPISFVTTNKSTYDIAFGDGIFLIVAIDCLLLSDDGYRWVQLSLPSTGGSNWQKITYLNGIFVMGAWAGTANKRLAYSEDQGRTWQECNVPEGNHIYTCVGSGYLNGVPTYIATSGNDGSVAMISNNGKDWTRHNLPISFSPGSGFVDVIFTSTNIILVAETFSAAPQSILTYDGTTWAVRSSTAFRSYTDVTRVPGKVLAIGNSGYESGSAIQQSLDNGATWTIVREIPWNKAKLIYGGGVQILYASYHYENIDDSPFAYSLDGTNWIDLPRNLFAFPNFFHLQAAYGNGVFVFVPGASNRITVIGLPKEIPAERSGKGPKGDDGDPGPQGIPGENGQSGTFREFENTLQWRLSEEDDWQDLISLNNPIDQDQFGIDVNGKLFILTDEEPTENSKKFLTSGEIWEYEQANARGGLADQLVPGLNPLFSAVSVYPEELRFQRVKYFSGMFFVCSSDGTNQRVAVSRDGGLTFYYAGVSNNANINSIEISPTGTICVGDRNASANTIRRTVNFGQTWTSATVPSQRQVSGIAYGDGVWVACLRDGTGNRAMRSLDDGLTWTDSITYADNGFEDICFHKGKFYIVSFDGTFRIGVSADRGATFTAVENYGVNRNYVEIREFKNALCILDTSQSTAARILYTKDEGATWLTSLTIPVLAQTVHSMKQVGDYLYVGGVNGFLTRTKNLTDWELVDSGTTLTISDIECGVVNGIPVMVIISSGSSGNRILTSNLAI